MPLCNLQLISSWYIIMWYYKCNVMNMYSILYTTEFLVVVSKTSSSMGCSKLPYNARTADQHSSYNYCHTTWSQYCWRGKAIGIHDVCRYVVFTIGTKLGISIMCSWPVCVPNTRCIGWQAMYSDRHWWSITRVLWSWSWCLVKLISNNVH